MAGPSRLQGRKRTKSTLIHRLPRDLSSLLPKADKNAPTYSFCELLLCAADVDFIRAMTTTPMTTTAARAATDGDASDQPYEQERPRPWRRSRRHG